MTEAAIDAATAERGFYIVSKTDGAILNSVGGPGLVQLVSGVKLCENQPFTGPAGGNKDKKYLHTRRLEQRIDH